ncbi:MULTISPECIES: hypothetical protein [unclassified Sphingobacterium]|uniref:hypothetical protein n=1 Tax=unclassified Sphingobacterium TaxID=2609468 RepID=UPI001AEAEA7E|nr:MULTISPECIES: hypothetical protein [unclassified Sphingobacterium]MDR6736230.1 glutamine amidotransferase PdxT [Sphingobacterium sp. 2149]
MKDVKKKYVPPRVEVMDIKMENSLAASSAIVIPGDGSGGGIAHEWKPGENKDWEITW